MKNIFKSTFLVSACLLLTVALSAQTFSGDLSDGTYDRIFSSDVDNGCNAMSTVSGVGTDTPYGIVQFSVSATGNYGLEVLGSSTIDDSVLSLYCAFDAADATTGLIAYDDDAPGTLLSHIEPSAGVILQAGTCYTAVVAAYQPSDAGGGTFDLEITGVGTAGSCFVAPAGVAPTMTEWGLFLFGLAMLTLGVVFMYNRVYMRKLA